ncbi:MAG: OmpA family protein [Bacteroidota bacterium]
MSKSSFLRHSILFLLSILFLPSAYSQGKTKPSDYGIKSKKALKFYQEGLQHDRYRDRGKAMAAYEAALQLEPNFAHAKYNLGTDLYVLRSYEEALPYLESAYELKPEDFPNAAFLLGEVYFFNGRYERALPFLQAFVNNGKGRKGDLKKAEGRLKHAIFAATAIKDSVEFNPVNLGPNINSPGDETHPFLTADGSTLLFTGKRRGSTGGGINEDLYISQWDQKAFAVAQNMGAVVNSRENQGAASITQDGRMIIFTACNLEDGYGSCDLYYATREGDTWSKPKNMGALINTRHWESYPMFSDDGKTLFFTSARPEGVGGRDIWYSNWTGETWTEAKNMGTPINSAGDEVAPFLHADGISFYFSSNFHPGFGRSDLFVSYKGEDGSWSEPKNMGYPLNSTAEDQSIFIGVNGKRAFYSSTRKGGLGGTDLYEFEIPKEVRPRIATFLRGKVVDSLSRKPLAASIKLLDVEKGDTVRRVSTDRFNGEFLASMPTEREYAAFVESKGYLFASKNFYLKELEDEKYFEVVIELAPFKEGKQVVLKNIFFEFNSATLKSTSTVELEFLFNFLKKNPRMKIEIQGHTDNVGSPEYNLQLSQNRAEAVKAYLEGKGINGKRVMAKGYGETQPVAGNITEEDRALNRRTEFKILSVGN